MRLLVDQFLLHLKAQRNFSRHTIKAYQADLAEFLAYLAPPGAAAPAPAALDRLTMRGYIAHINGRKISQIGRAHV